MEARAEQTRDRAFWSARILNGRQDAGRRLTSTIGAKLELLHIDMNYMGVHEAVHRVSSAAIAHFTDLATKYRMPGVMNEKYGLAKKDAETEDVRTKRRDRRAAFRCIREALKASCLHERDFDAACKSTTLPEAMRTAKTLHAYSSRLMGECASIPGPPAEIDPELERYMKEAALYTEGEVRRIEQGVALARMAFGYFLETFASRRALELRDVREHPNVEKKKRQRPTRQKRPSKRASKHPDDGPEKGQSSQTNHSNHDQDACGEDAVDGAQDTGHGTDQCIESVEEKQEARDAQEDEYTENGERVMNAAERLELSRWFDDSYKVAVFTQVNSEYILGAMRPTCGTVSQVESDLAVFGRPCLELTNCISSLPDLSEYFVRQWFSTHSAGAAGKTALFGSTTTLDCVRAAETIGIINGSGVSNTVSGLSMHSLDNPSSTNSTDPNSSNSVQLSAADERQKNRNEKAKKLTAASQRNIATAAAAASRSTKQPKSAKNTEKAQRATACSKSTAIILSAHDGGPPTIDQQLSSAPMTAIYANETRKEITTLLIRATMASSRGWELSAVSLLKSYELVRRVMTDILKLSMTGMHSNLHPGLRPTWLQRKVINHVVDTCMRASSEEIVMKCQSAFKESIRIVATCYLAECASARAACEHNGHCLGGLTSVPFGFPVPAMMAACNALVMAGVRLAVLVSQLPADKTADASLLIDVLSHVCPGDGVKTPSAAQGGAQPPQNHNSTTQEETAPMDVSMGVSMHIPPIVSDEVNPQSSTPGEQAGGQERDGANSSTSKPAKGEPVVKRVKSSIEYSSGWFSRVSTCRNNDLTAFDVVQHIMNGAFTTSCVPFWIQAKCKDVRISRLDVVQQQAVHEHCSAHTATAALPDDVALRVQRAALNLPRAPLMSLPEVAKAVGVLPELADTLTAKGSLASITEQLASKMLSLPAKHGASIILFAKVAATREKLLSVALGKRATAFQFMAMRRRYGCVDKPLEAPLPHYAAHLYACLDCARVANATVELNAKPLPYDAVGISASMRRAGPVLSKDEYLCARRSSAQTKQTGYKDLSADPANFFELEPMDERAFLKTLDSVSESQSMASQLRRDCGVCQSQELPTTACGRAMLRIPVLGRAVRVFGKWYALCCYCGVVFIADQRRKFNGLPCCGHCDASILDIEEGTTEYEAARAKTREDFQSVLQAPAPEERHAAETPVITLGCRFCGKRREGPQASRFQVVHAPLDDGGRNGRLPPPLRLCVYCPQHARPWVPEAHRKLPTGVVFAHITERCAPVFGAETGRRGLDVEYERELKAKRQRLSAIESKLRKRVAGMGGTG